MVALVSSPYPIATFFTLNMPQTRPRIPVTRCSIRVSSSRRIRRKNTLRPKILKTLTKPYPDTIPEELGTRIEPNDVVSLEPALVKSDYGVVEELEASVGFNEVQVVRDVRGTNVMGFKVFPGQTMVKIVVSFVGLFVLQTVVTVWIMGSGEKDRTEGRYARELGPDGSVIVGDSGLTSIDELKIAEIRRMVRVVKEDEKRRKNMEKGERELEDESDDDEEEEEKSKTDNSLRNGIAKEVDGRLTMLRKKSPMPVQNVHFLKKAGSSVKDVGNENVAGKEEYNRLMFEAKRKFRSQVTEVGNNKPKGFEGINDVREKDGNGTEYQRSNLGMGKNEKSVSQSLEPLQSFKKAAASEEENLGKGINGSSSLRSDSSINNLSMGMNKSAKPENGVLQDSSIRISSDDGAKLKESSVIEIQESRRKKNDLTSPTSTMPTMPRRNEKSGSRKLKSKSSRRTNNDKNKTDAQELWWSTLPCVFAILMQKGHGSEAQQGFYTPHIKSDAKYEASYTVAFEDQNDARNFSYILDSAFGDLPDTAVDVVMMSTQELKEILNSVNKKVVVARKGELKLYAGQPLEDAESALRLLVK